MNSLSVIESVDTSEEPEVGGPVARPAAELPVGANSSGPDRFGERRQQAPHRRDDPAGHFATLTGSSHSFKPWTKTQHAGMVGHFGMVDAEVIEALALSWPAPWGSVPHLL